MGTSISWGVTCNGLASHPGGIENILSRFMLRKPEISAGLMSHVARNRLYFTGHSQARGVHVRALLTELGSPCVLEHTSLQNKRIFSVVVPLVSMSLGC